MSGDFVQVKALIERSAYRRLRAYARRTGRSSASVAGTILETAIFGASDWDEGSFSNEAKGET